MLVGCGHGFLPDGIRLNLSICFGVMAFALFACCGEARAHTGANNYSLNILSDMGLGKSGLAFVHGARQDAFALLASGHEFEEKSSRRVNPVRLAQVNFDFTGFGKPRRYRPQPAPKIKFYKAPKAGKIKPSAGFFGSKKKHAVRVQSAHRRSKGVYSYIITGSDGRAYRVYPNGKRRNSRRVGFERRTTPVRTRYSGYRTMCVRTCDGYYYPISNGTSRSRLRRDRNICQSSCGVPTELFYYPNAGGSVKSMVDLKGKKYSSMKFAFKYRKKVANDCRCKEQPWAMSEIIRHEQYAAEEVDRGIKRVKLVKISESAYASAQVKFLDRVEVMSVQVTEDEGDIAAVDESASGASVGGDAKVGAGDASADVVVADGGGVEEHVLDEQLVAGMDPVELVTNGTDLVDVEAARVVNVKRPATKKRSRERRNKYKLSSNRMKRWWRSNRY